jgi:hypothetical protein
MANNYTPTLTGARAVFYIGPTQVALATGVSITQNINYEPIQVLDLLEVEEFCEVSYNCSMSCETMRSVGGITNSPGSPQNQGLFPYVGYGNQGLLSVLNQAELTATITDGASGNPVLKVERIKPQGNNMDIRAGQAVANNLTFVCVRALDPQDPQY